MEKGQNNYSTFLRQGGENGNQVIFNGYRLEVLIPKSYFELGLSSIVGSKLETIGIFKFRVKEREGGKFETFSFKTPNQIIINFDDTTTIKEVNGKLIENDNSSDKEKDEEDMEIESSVEDDKPLSLIENDEDEQEDSVYQVFILNNGTAFLESIRFVQSSKNVEKFVKLLYAGKLPKMAYEDVYYFHSQVEDENSTPLGIPAATRAAIISELCRNKKNKQQAYRLALKFEEKNKSDYKFMPLKALPDTVSTFSGLLFENVNKSLVYAISNTKDDKPEVITSIEKIIVNKD